MKKNRTSASRRARRGTHNVPNSSKLAFSSLFLSAVFRREKYRNFKPTNKKKR